MNQFSPGGLHHLRKCAVERKLLYSCGPSSPYETVDPKSGQPEPLAPKPWQVKVTANDTALYFTDSELYHYLTELLQGQ